MASIDTFTHGTGELCRGILVGSIGADLCRNTCVLTHCIGDGFHVLVRATQRFGVRLYANKFPPAGSGQSNRVDLAHVITVRLRCRRKRPYDRRGVRVHVRQGRRRVTGARRP